MSAKYTKPLVFGLDIGTRSVVGTVGYLEGDRFKVLCQKVKEHETRAMLDGQIHDIGRVAETLSQVKKECEEAVGCSLNQVCIAAAGRVLQTLDTHVDMILDEEREVNKEDITNLLSLGVEKAYKEFVPKESLNVKFYCVGYSVVKYYLNNYPMGNLEGHKASVISADIIATFLPDDVVDGLYKAVELADLEVANLTLEPIAAISVAIPERFRMLNIALVDVGAGTSDISITREGSIVAYGMIPMAGDKFTDRLAMEYLTDFDMAEHIKKGIGEGKEITYEDIMGLSQTVSAEDAYKVIKPLMEEETKAVSDEIIRLNGGKSVSAVFVVGGGASIKGYTDMLAEKLSIQKERVALRGSEVMGKIDFLNNDALKTSLMVTPIGICLNYYEHTNNLIFVTFNGTRLKMYDNGHTTVLDACVQAGFPNDGLFPKRGRGLTYSVNGKSRIAKGEIGEACEITVNGKPADITTKILSNDKIVIKESTAGVRARLQIKDLPEYKEGLNLNVDGKTLKLSRPVLVNGKEAAADYEICEDDRVEILDNLTKEQLESALASKPETQSRPYTQPQTLPQSESQTRTNARTETQSQGMSNTSITVLVNDEEVALNGKKEYVFVDVFDHIDFDLNDSRGRSIVTLCNGAPAVYLNPLSDGDILNIYWKDL